MLRTFTGGAAVSGETVGTVDEGARAGAEGAAETAAAAAELGRAGPKTEAATSDRALRPAPEAAEAWDGATRDDAAAEAGAATPLEARRPALE
jgi:hypothetical protein